MHDWRKLNLVQPRILSTFTPPHSSEILFTSLDITLAAMVSTIEIKKQREMPMARPRIGSDDLRRNTSIVMPELELEIVKNRRVFIPKIERNISYSYRE